MKTIKTTKPGMIVGIYINIPNNGLFADAIRACEKYLPHTYIFPCGNSFAVNTIADIPAIDTPCPCGDDHHWFVKYKIDPALDKRSGDKNEE